MEITIKITPGVDLHDDVLSVVNGIFSYGGESLSVDPSAWQANNRKEQGPGQFTDEELLEQQHINLMNQTGNPEPGNSLSAAQAFADSPANAPGANGTTQQGPQDNAPFSTAAAGGVELDANGLPWDARIHSDAKERKTQAGVWKKKKGVADDLIAKVTAELKASMAATGAPAQPGQGSLPQGGVLGNMPGGDQPQPGSQTPPPGAHSQPQTPPPGQGNLPPAGAAPVTREVAVTGFAPFMAYTMARVGNPGNPGGVLTYAHLNEVAYQCGLKDPATGKGELRMLENRPDLLDQALQWVDWLATHPAQPLLGPQ